MSDYNNPTLMLVAGGWISIIMFFTLLFSIARTLKDQGSQPLTKILATAGLCAGIAMMVMGGQQLGAAQQNVVDRAEKVVVTSVYKNVRKNYVVINDTYKIATSDDIPKGATITISEDKQSNDYILLEYEIK